MIHIRHITFTEILPVWKNYLWITRESEIEPVSIIIYKSFPYKYNVSYTENTPTFFGAFYNNELVGVNSGHLTDEGYRSRGLFVFPEYRLQNIGTELLSATIQKGYAEGAEFCWSIPRISAINCYVKSGFKVTSEQFCTECSDNVFVATLCVR